MSRKLIAIVPARGGSKGIPQKNIKPFCGRPLLYWATMAAVDCPEITEVYVSTDSTEIAQVVEGEIYGAQVLSRRAEHATDTAATDPILLDAAKRIAFDDIVLIQATSPLLESRDLSNAIRQYAYRDYDSLLSVVRQHRFIWRTFSYTSKLCGVVPENYVPDKRPRRQDWPGELIENGAFYITSREALIVSNCRVSGKIGYYEMPADTYFEIDSESDWQIAEQLKERRLALQYQAVRV